MISTTKTSLRALAALLGLGAALGAQATLYTYPAAAAPCNTTLQACVNGVNADDIIVLDTDNHINEEVVILKDLALAAAQGRRPSVRTVIARASTDDVSVRVEGLTSFNGASRVRGVLNPGGGDLRLSVRNSQLLGTTLDSALAIVTSNNAGPYGTASVYVADNTISQSGTNDYCAPAINAIGFVSRLSIDIIGNDVLATSLGQCAAISLYNGSPDLLRAQLHNNTVRGNGADAGIQVRSYSRLEAVVAGNLVAGGFDAGLRVLADNTNSAADVRLLNNTVVGTQYGLIASARTDLGANLTGVVANNVFARHPVFGMLIGDLPGLLDHHNLVFDSPKLPNTRPYGPNTRHGNPSFANEAGADYRLRADSDAIDHGDDGAVDGTYPLDLDDQPRRVRTVDMGAYEFQGTPMPPSTPGPIAPVPATGPWALGWGAALLALVAGARLRRRR